ncbi:MAG: hypothetical protein PHP42_14100, partial [Bacteroidota bacterium]|nr:hypothetical protein [Bacteroidota bacterium]
ELGFAPIQSTIAALSKVGMMPRSESLTITTIADKKSGRLLGANVVGRDGAIQRANIFSVAIQHGLNVNDLAELNLIYSPPFAPLWDGVVVSGLNMKKLL